MLYRVRGLAEVLRVHYQPEVAPVRWMQGLARVCYAKGPKKKLQAVLTTSELK